MKVHVKLDIKETELASQDSKPRNHEHSHSKSEQCIEVLNRTSRKHRDENKMLKCKTEELQQGQNITQLHGESDDCVKIDHGNVSGVLHDDSNYLPSPEKHQKSKAENMNCLSIGKGKGQHYNLATKW